MISKLVKDQHSDYKTVNKSSSYTVRYKSHLVVLPLELETGDVFGPNTIF